MNLYHVAQAVSFLGMAGNILSFLQKRQRTIIIFQLFASMFWSLHYILLGISENTFYVAVFINIIGIARAVVFSNKKLFRADNKLWLVGFISLYVTAYVLTFTVFGKTPTPTNLIFELLPVIAMTANTIGFSLKTARGTRLLNFVNSPCWLSYSIFSASIGGIVSELLSITATVIGYLRYDSKKKNQK